MTCRSIPSRQHRAAAALVCLSCLVVPGAAAGQDASRWSGAVAVADLDHARGTSADGPLATYSLTVGVPLSSGERQVPRVRVRSIRPAAARPAVLETSTPRTAQSWIKRHPALFGAMVGSAIGAIAVGAAVDAEASPVGFFGGGAAGALVGWAVGR